MEGNDMKPSALVRQLSETSSEAEESFQSASDLLNDLNVSCKKSTSRARAKLKKAETEAIKARASARKRCPKYIILVGLPGSGKSHFAKALVLNGHGDFVRCNQDDLGRKACFNLIQSHCNGKSKRQKGGGISSPVKQFKSMVDVGTTGYTGIPFSRATTLSLYVPILFATSPFRATRSAPYNTTSTFPCCISSPLTLSAMRCIGTSYRISSHADSRAPCSRGRVSSTHTWTFFPWSCHS